jgi:hypothetical protein
LRRPSKGILEGGFSNAVPQTAKKPPGVARRRKGFVAVHSERRCSKSKSRLAAHQTKRKAYELFDRRARKKIMIAAKRFASDPMI